MGPPIDSYLEVERGRIFGSCGTHSQTPFEHCGYNIRMLRPMGSAVIPPQEYVMTEVLKQSRMTLCLNQEATEIDVIPISNSYGF